MAQWALWLAALAAVGCGERGAVTFNLKAPDNALFNPVAQPGLVSEYDLRTAAGAVIGIVSAVPVQGTVQGDSGRLPLGALLPTAATDVYVTALSGGKLLGLARIRDVVVASGKQRSYDAELRKPLIFVGSMLPTESDPGNRTTPVEILDPVALADLAHAAAPAPIVAGGMTAGATTWDGRFLVAAQGSALTAFDTGLGANVAGSLTLPFAPSRVVVAPRDTAIVALDAGLAGSLAGGPAGSPAGDGRLALLPDVAGFTAAPQGVSPVLVTLTGQVARTAAFSPDGTRLYVLTGGASVDPCSPGALPPANAILTFALDGSSLGSASLSGFASDLAVDADSGEVVVADVAGRQVAIVDPQSGTLSPILGNLGCPSAVRVVDGVVFAVTSDRDTTQPNAFLLQRVGLKGGAPISTAFVGPQYQIPIDSTPSANGNIETANLPVRPVSIEAYELAVTPDGSRAQFATRAHYKEAGTKFTFSQEDCAATFDIVEYGLYAVDLRTGNASYSSRSTLVQSPAGGVKCVDCAFTDVFGDTTHEYADCDSTPGDRPAGLAASFGP